MSQVTVKTIAKEELLQRLGTAQVVNVLEPEWHKLGLIKGSKTIPLSELDRRVDELDRSREVVTYCANDQCTASSEAAKKLAARGFTVAAYEGGIKEWKEAGLPVEQPVEHSVAKTSTCCG